MIGATRLAYKLKVARNGSPFALGADARMSMFAGIDAVVDVSAAQKCVVLAMSGN